MQTELQLSVESEVHTHPGKTQVQDEDPSVASSTLDNVMQQQQQKQPAKKPTRQWAAWTREEEECFFNALRQVGKNFEKITHRVQSKNKDQVRHYYYRLVRRMNKLLGPGLCLDAKNSKDTNAAMLRWWSLLEKYSCKASKLHLKPRRFKIFVEALEHQLLKDRKRNVRKRSAQGENCSPMASSTVSNQSRASGLDTCTVKLILVDSQNIQKLGPGKASLKRNVSIGVNRSNNKGDITAMKPPRQRRKPGAVSSSAFKKWEKAAIAGVSLVADAAEHLERAANDKEVELDQSTPVQKAPDPVDKVLPPLPTISHNLFAENNINASVKLKLQLYPIDDGTRKALEMDNHNPHLELTLSTRKKISSVLEHLHRKWGNSSVASGELMLLPYGAQRENLVGYQRWTQDSVVSAADVYTMMGSPPLFRLRYGWFSITGIGSVALQDPSESCYVPGMHNVNVDDQLTSVDGNQATVSCHKETGSKIFKRQLENMSDGRFCNGTAVSAGEWADSLTNISVGDLLSEVPHDMDALSVSGSSQCYQQMPFSCDSFDAAIAAHIYRHQDKMETASTLAAHASSIWDAEETCDAFSFQKNPVPHEVSRSSDVASLSACKFARTNSMGSGGLVEELPDAEGPTDTDYTGCEDPMDECLFDPHNLDNSVKDFSALTDLYWPESLAPLDMDIPSAKYCSEDLVLSDSLGGLNRLIASSLDAFQNCSFFGLDKKEQAPTVEAGETASISGFKIGSQC